MTRPDPVVNAPIVDPLTLEHRRALAVITVSVVIRQEHQVVLLEVLVDDVPCDGPLALDERVVRVVCQDVPR